MVTLINLALLRDLTVDYLTHTIKGNFAVIKTYTTKSFKLKFIELCKENLPSWDYVMEILSKLPEMKNCFKVLVYPINFLQLSTS